MSSAVNITAEWGRAGQVKVTLSGVTDDIVISFLLAPEEARKLIRVIEDRLK
jgi:hypothetical protein